MYSLNFYRMFPQNQPYTMEHPTRPANPEHGDDDFCKLYVGKYILDLRYVQLPGDDRQRAGSPRRKSSEYPWRGHQVQAVRQGCPRQPAGNPISYEYLGEFNPGIQHTTINTRIAVIAHDDDGMDVTWTAETGSYSIIDKVGKPNHREGYGKMPLPRWPRRMGPGPSDWKRLLLDAMKEWTRVTDWHLADKDRLLRRPRRQQGCNNSGSRCSCPEGTKGFRRGLQPPDAEPNPPFF